MAQHHDHHGTKVPQDTNFDNADQPGIAQPYTQTEIEELLYGDDWPAVERLSRLQTIRTDLANLEATDFGDDENARGLDHALHGEVVGLFRGAAGGVCHHVDFVVAFQHCAQGEGVVAHFGPQAGNHHFLLAVGLQGVTHFLVIPGVHGGTLKNVLAREDVQALVNSVLDERYAEG